MIQELNSLEPESINEINLDIQVIKDVNYKRNQHNTYIYSQSKSLKQIQEVVTILKSISASIEERRRLIKQFVLLTEQKTRKQKELDDPKNGSPLMEKKKLNDEIYKMC